MTENEIYDLLVAQALEIGRSAVDRAARRYLKVRHLGTTKTPRKKISTALRRKVYERFKGICQGECGVWIPFENATVDHIISLSEGGNDDMSNYQLMCQSDNSSKGGRDWMSQSKATGKLYTELTRNIGDKWKGVRQ